MKILISGGYSYPGLNIAKKFIDEKHQVTAIDSLARGQKNPQVLNHRFFNLKADDPECRKVFESTVFDIVIFISGSLDNKNINNKSADMSDIANIANLSAEFKVKKFVLLTSSEIYGNSAGSENLPFTENSKINPVTPGGMGDNVREYYAIKIGKHSKMPVLCLRVSDIYGPCIMPGNNGGDLSDLDAKDIKSLIKLAGGSISSIINNAVKNRSIKISGNPESSRDYIYIDDAVNAVYRVSISRELTGIFNVSTQTETTLNEIASILKDLIKIKTVKNEKIRNNGNVERRCVSNKNLKSATGWEPLTDITNGLRKCIEAHSEAEAAIKRPRKKDVKKDGTSGKPARSAGRAVLTVFENVLLFLVFAFLHWGETLFNINLPDVVIDYSIIYIIIAAVVWGQVQAYLAMFLASALFIAMSIFTGTDIIAFIYTPENLVTLAIYLLVGIITGYAIERRNREIESREIALDALCGKYTFLLDIYNQTKLIKNELENQVINTEDSFSAIYETIQKVDSLEIEAVYSGAISAIEKIMKTDSVSIYINSDPGNAIFMRLKARSAALGDSVPNSVNINDNPHFREVIEGRCNFVNRDFNPSVPLIIAPVVDEKKVIAVISINDTAFENLTSNYENLFSTVITLITNAIKRAYYFSDSLANKRYIQETRVLNPETFEKILSEVRKYKEELDMSYSLLTIKPDGKDLKEISGIVTKDIRDNDYIGIGKDNGVYVLLSNTKNNYAHIVVERLNSHGIETDIVGEGSIDV